MVAIHTINLFYVYQKTNLIIDLFIISDERNDLNLALILERAIFIYLRIDYSTMTSAL